MRIGFKRGRTKERWEPAELLEFKPARFTYEVQEKLNIYDIPVRLDSKQIEKLFNDVVEVELEETEKETDATRGKVSVRRNGKGKYYSIKNIHLDLIGLIEFGFNLMAADKRIMLIVAAIFLKKILGQLGVDMEEEQVAACVALYKAAKRVVVTDDNIMEHIARELKESGYCELSRKEIDKALSELIQMGIVTVEEGRYEVTEEIYFAG